MPEYRAFDNLGAIVDRQDVTGPDAAVVWVVSVATKGAVLIERRSGEDWVCFEEYRRANHSEGADASQPSESRAVAGP